MSLVCTSFLESLSSKRLGIVVDDFGTPRAALIAPAQGISTEEVNTLLQISGGLPFVAVTPNRSQALLLQPMPPFTKEVPAALVEAPLYVQLCSVEAREGIATGISAHDRAATVRILGDPHPQPRALVRPGHIFPLLTREGGVLVRAAIPEGAVDAMALAGFTDAAVVVDLLDAAGEPLSPAAAIQRAEELRIPVIALSDLVRYRLAHESLVERGAAVTIPTSYAGDVQVVLYRSRIHEGEHVAIVKGAIQKDEPTLVRVQTEHTISDVFGGGPLLSRAHLHNSLHAIAERGAGVVLYLRRNPPEQASPPVSAPKMMRDYGIGAQILRDLGVGKIELLASASRSLVGLDTFGIEIVAQRPIPDGGCMRSSPVS